MALNQKAKQQKIAKKAAKRKAAVALKRKANLVKHRPQAVPTTYPGSQHHAHHPGCGHDHTHEHDDDHEHGEHCSH